MLNPENNLIPIFYLHRQSILKEFNLLALVLTPKGKPSGLKDYNNLNKVDIDNVLSFIDYIITDKQAEGLLPIEIEIWDAEMFIKMVAQEPDKYYLKLI